MSFCIKWNLQTKKQRRKGSEKRWAAVKLKECKRMFQTPNTCISQTELVNSPEIAQQGCWKQPMQSRPKIKHLACSSLKIRSCIFLLSSLHSKPQAAPLHEVCCVSRSLPFAARCSEPVKHIQDKLRSTAAWPNQHRTKPLLAPTAHHLQTCD